MGGLSFKDTDRFLPLRLGATARDTLQEFIDIDVTAEDLVGILKRNQAYRDLFGRFVNQKTKQKEPGTKEEKEATSPTHRLINLLGMLGSRNLILALRMHKALEKRFPLTQDGSVDIKASDYLKNSLEWEEFFLRNNLDYSETAFSAAVYFDWLKRALSRDPSFKKGLEAYTDKIWKRAQRTGLAAYFLARHVRSLSPKQALAAGMLLHGGKLLAAAADPAYAEWEGKLEEKALPPLAELIQERSARSAAHEEFSALSLSYFDVFKRLAPAIRHYREPYVLQGQDHVQYDLASLLYLANLMGRAWKLPASEKDPLFKEWSHPSLKHLKLSPSTLISVMKSAMAVH
jgi:HD-like signal output (HDOD) protein